MLTTRTGFQTKSRNTICCQCRRNSNWSPNSTVSVCSPHQTKSSKCVLNVLLCLFFPSFFRSTKKRLPTGGRHEKKLLNEKVFSLFSCFFFFCSSRSSTKSNSALPGLWWNVITWIIENPACFMSCRAGNKPKTYIKVPTMLPPVRLSGSDTRFWGERGMGEVGWENGYFGLNDCT